MKPTISHSLTSDARSVPPLRSSLSSIERRPGQRADGLGILIASSVVVPRALSMGPARRKHVTPGCGHGDAKTPLLQKNTTVAGGSKNCTDYRKIRLSRCVPSSTDAAQFASVPHHAFWWIIVIRAATSGGCSARHATHFSVGTSARPAPSFNFRSTWQANSHADSLLELANAP